MKSQNQKRKQEMISLASLARRWEMSSTGTKRIWERAGIPCAFLGAVAVAERAEIRSVYLGGRRGGTLRLLLEDIERYEEEVTMV